MEVEFELVRFGKKRKSPIAERALKDNVRQLKNSIRSFLEEDNTLEKVQMDMIIPGRGYNILIYISFIKEEYLKNRIKTNYPNSIYSGSYSKIEQNIGNPVW